MFFADEVFDGLPFQTTEKGAYFSRWKLTFSGGGIFLEKRNSYLCFVILYEVTVFSWKDEDPHKAVARARSCLNTIRRGINEAIPPEKV